MDCAAWANDAGHLSKNRCRLSDVADQSVGDNRVECRRRKIQAVSITDSKIDPVADIFVLRESARSFNERKALIHADRFARKVAAVCEKAHHRTRAAADFQYLSRRG